MMKMTQTHLIKMPNFPINPQPSEIFYDKDKDKVFRYLGARDPKSLQLLPIEKQWVDITNHFYRTNLFKED